MYNYCNFTIKVTLNYDTNVDKWDIKRMTLSKKVMHLLRLDTFAP